MHCAQGDPFLAAIMWWMDHKSPEDLPSLSQEQYLDLAAKLVSKNLSQMESPDLFCTQEHHPYSTASGHFLWSSVQAVYGTAFSLQQDLPKWYVASSNQCQGRSCLSSCIFESKIKVRFSMAVRKSGTCIFQATSWSRLLELRDITQHLSIMID